MYACLHAYINMVVWFFVIDSASMVIFLKKDISWSRMQALLPPRSVVLTKEAPVLVVSSNAIAKNGKE